MLDRLFKPAWQSASADKRLKSIADMDSGYAETNNILFELAKNDPDSSVRLGAIEKLEDIALLAELNQLCSDSKFQQAVDKRLDILVGDLSSPKNSEYEALMERFPDLGIRIAAHAPGAELRQQALQALSGEQYLRVLEKTGYMDCRQTIAERLSNIDDIEAARKILRGKDKTAERILKNRIDAHRQHQRQLEEQKKRIEKLITEAEYLSEHDWLPEFNARCGILNQQWQDVDFEIGDDDRNRFLSAREKIDGILRQREFIEQTRQKQQEIVEGINALFNRVSELDQGALVEEMNDVSVELDRKSSRWEELAEIVEPEETTSRTMLGEIKAVKDLVALVSEVNRILESHAETAEFDEAVVGQLETLLKALRWPGKVEKPLIVRELTSQLQDRRHKKRQEAEEYRQKLDRVHRNIKRIIQLSRAGNLAGAKQAVEKVSKAFGEIEEKELGAVQERFDDALKTLDDMGDWKNYATEPKYVELCESMEKLVDSSKPEEKRYQRMQALQKQWKELGHSDVSEQYWPRFKEAADKVYQPCAEYFQKRRETQKANLEKRQEIVEQMRQLLEDTDWENNPDYKSAQSRFFEIGKQFTGVKDVEHKPGQKQWRQFSKVKDQIKSRLAVAYDENIEIKRRLVDQARQLAESESVPENLERLKSLQNRWGQVGITRRKQDQKAWSEFRKYCDDIYHQVRQLQRDHRKDNDRQLDIYRRVIASIRTLAKSSADTMETDRQFRDLQEEYRQLPELPAEIPRKLTDAIQRDFDKACRQYEDRLQQISDNEKTRELERLRSKALLCARQESLGLSPSTEDLETIDRQWLEIELQDPSLSRRIEARRQSANTDIDRAAISDQRRLMCIQLEIALGLDSPDEDRELRMQYQLEQMNRSGLGQGIQHDDAWFDEIELEWLCMPGAESEIQALLDERFQALLTRRAR